MGEFYHASKRELSIGARITAEDRNIVPELKDAEKIFDVYRPEGFPSRKNSFFAMSRNEDSVAYFEKQNPDNELFLYRVEMPLSRPHPFVLVGQIRNLVAKESEDLLLEKLALEYWTPTRDWKFCEFLSESMIICERVEPLKDAILGAQSRLADDTTSVHRHFLQ